MLVMDGFVKITRVKAYAELVGVDNNQHTADQLGLFSYQADDSLIWLCKATDTWQGGCTTGGTVSLVTM